MARGSCLEDNRTLTEVLFQNKMGLYTNVFVCEALSIETKQDGTLTSQVKIEKQYFGHAGTKVITVASGSQQSGCNNIPLIPAHHYLVFANFENGVYTRATDKWTSLIKEESDKASDQRKVQSDLKIIETFSKIFRCKKSGHFIFKNAQGIIVADGAFKHGNAIGIWKHYNEKGHIVREYDLDKNTIKQLDQ